MRILVTTPYFYPVVGGSQNYILGLFSALRKLDPKAQVDILTYNTEHTTDQEVIEGLHVYRVPAFEILHRQFALPNYWMIWKLLRCLRQQHRYDFINPHTRFFDTAWWGPLAGWFLGAKTILTDHCASHPDHPNPVVGFIAKSVDYMFIATIAHSYTRIMVVSEATRTFLQSLGLQKSVVIPGGVSMKVFSKRQPLPAKLKFLANRQKRTIITFAGRLIASKGVREFAQVAQRITARYPKVVFVIAGQGPLLQDLEPLHSSQIKFVGELSHRETAALLQRTDIFVHPSQHHEGLPLVVLEAGAAGCAVIATPTGEVKYLLGKKRGILCDAMFYSTEKNIEDLINSPRKRFQLAQNLKNFVEKNYTWTESAKKFHRLLNPFVIN